MSSDVTDATPVTSRDELVAWLEAGAKPKDRWRIGTEHEKVAFHAATNAPVPYEGGIEALLEGLAARLGWERVEEAGRLIGLTDPATGAGVSLEPGGQFELSGAPVATLHETAAELEAHFADVKAVADPLGVRFLALGAAPLWPREATPVMPKGRYRIMADYLPTVGTGGLDMMFRTATVQVNLDFADEADMVRKLRAGLALQPLATALFANSPFLDGAPCGLLSARSEAWTRLDPKRTGMLPFAFEGGFGFEAYADWALDVPLFFVKRGATYHDVAGASFRDLVAGRVPGLPGERATLSDWANHLTTMFPEARLKRVIEMRGADAGPRAMLVALPAFWTGLLYDEGALDGALDLVRGWGEDDRGALRRDAPRLGLDAAVAGRPLREVARDALALARAGLRARARAGGGLPDEAAHLDALDGVLEEGPLAARWLARAERDDAPWPERVGRVMAEAAY